MKYLKKFNESLGAASREYIDGLCKKYLIEEGSHSFVKSYTINDDGTVDVDGDVYMSFRRFTSNVLPIKFGKVSRHFDCENSSLVSLNGCPNYVGGRFKCNGNRLTSLKGIPDYVGDYVNAAQNNISEVIFPSYVGDGEIYLNSNNITLVPKTEYNVYYTQNPIHTLVDYVLEDIFYPIDDDVYKEKFKDILDRLDEFEVIKDKNKLDLISLNSLYDYYLQDTLTPNRIFNENNFKNIKGYEIY